MIKYNATKNPADCCGCRSCEQICKKRAITMKENEEGYLYPHVDLESCVECGLCEKVCPMESGHITETTKQTFLAAQVKDKEILRRSSSGGIFSLIALFVIQKGGVVYGAAFSKDMRLRHIRVDNADDLEKLRKSKYVQSDINNVYTQVKKDLIDGIKVYFVGTPCQVQGLKLFLRRKYDNLLTSDFICHGVPSQKIFKTVCDHLQSSQNGTLIDYNFRDKHIGGWSCTSSSSFKTHSDKKKYLVKDRQMDAYFNAFIKGNMMRYSCYSCPFANPNRCSDITLADCWGIRRINTHFNETFKYGVSMIAINTEEGERLWAEIKDNAFYEPVEKEWAVNSNGQLNAPTPMGGSRRDIYSLAFENYNAFISKFSNYSLISYIKFYLKYHIRNNRLTYGIAMYIKAKLKTTTRKS